MSIDFNSTLGGGVDIDLDNIRIKELPQINTDSKVALGLDNIRIKELPQINSDSKVALGLDNIRIKELPSLDLHLELALKPTRVHFPVNLRMGFCALGYEILSLCLCGESMVVTEDYRPHTAEGCR
jgi:hypothetical protein